MTRRWAKTLLFLMLLCGMMAFSMAGAGAEGDMIFDATADLAPMGQGAKQDGDTDEVKGFTIH